MPIHLGSPFEYDSELVISFSFVFPFVVTALWMDAFLDVFFYLASDVYGSPFTFLYCLLDCYPLLLPLMSVYSLCWDDILFASVSKYSAQGF